MPRLLRDPNKDVRDWAAFVVFLRKDDSPRIYDTPEIREALLELACDPDAFIRYEAFRSLGALREKRTAPILAQELRNNKEFIYSDLAEAAGKLGDPLLIPVLEEALESFTDESQCIRNALDLLRQGL